MIALICSLIRTQNIFFVIVNACVINREKLLHLIMVIVKCALNTTQARSFERKMVANRCISEWMYWYIAREKLLPDRVM